MTITLDDVSQILGIPIKGLPVEGIYLLDKGKAEELLIQGLGLTAENVPKVKKGHVTLEWLRKTFSNMPEDATAEIVDCHVRAYLLFFLGCTIFNDKSGVSVHVAYLQVLLEVDNVSKYAWNGCCVGFIYIGEWQKHLNEMGDKLRVYDIVGTEGYNINRVLRQVGYVQRIPGRPIQPKYGSKKANVRYNVSHYTFSRLWTSGDNHVLSKFERGERVVASSDCVNRYIDWFNNISHPRMQNPKYFSQVHRLPPVNWELIVTEATRLLKESLDIGGTQDVHGMLAREKMIYNILQFKQIIQESSQSGGGGENSGDVGENSGGGQDNGGDGGENSGDNMDIDTTKLTNRQLAMRQKRKK
ncbi:hypothetical protein IFM89_031222 [Coptis chinensis]|uniref:Aminotransferase-like plant mobile domain-containing protein n=1 Tax=Coptis chinensis TaxID=261450 RepID=A0A835MCV6_9MAGN|nr:hypothetical protein IFM89_031222 [Coptis chinensis]